mmetsp:Transcript_104242/g.238676  ORF Transcript_104242/g.238676 Transcript_104242/m.238676 type:complete len:484 (+) Transcript_104242:62-1513(+)
MCSQGCCGVSFFADLPELPEGSPEPSQTVAALKDEIAQIQTAVGVGELRSVLSVANLRVPRLVLHDGNAKPTDWGAGPWETEVVMTGHADAYAAPMKLLVRFNSEYPCLPPRITFRSIVLHAGARDGVLPEQFYQFLGERHQRFPFRTVLLELLKYLQDPLPALQVDPSMVSQARRALQLTAEESLQRLSVITRYKALRVHPSLFDEVEGWRPDWFHPGFRQALQADTREAWQGLTTEHVPGAVFSCPIFTEEFCDMVMAEVESFSNCGLPARRPNSMNRYGLILNHIGLEGMFDRLQDEVLSKMAAHYWPEIGPFDGHHSFIVRYKEQQDLGLDMHTDDSDVTFNVCLGKEFTGAGLSFCGVMGLSTHRKHTYTLQHKRGSMCFHLGRQRHGADDITSGERFNLIVWNTSRTYRATHHYKAGTTIAGVRREDGPPDPVCLSYTHDRDYGVFKEYPSAAALEHKGRGWCPPSHAEYADFVAEA